MMIACKGGEVESAKTTSYVGLTIVVLLES